MISTQIECPLCDAPMDKVDRPTRIMNGRVQWAYDCACGVEGWVMKSRGNGPVPRGQLFVMSFTSKEPITVTTKAHDK